MMRVLVPLDGTAFATSIIPDAVRLAGPDGELILVRDASVTRNILVWTENEQLAAYQAVGDYLENLAQTLRREGLTVQAQALDLGDPAFAIDEAARIFKVDMIACATHGRSPLGRLWKGSVTHAALAHSPAPVLLRHAEIGEDTAEYPDRTPRRILVPLDGSVLAETALPLAQALAAQWQAEIHLVHAVADLGTIPASPIGGFEVQAYQSLADTRREMEAYLHQVAKGTRGKVRIHVLHGRTVDALAQSVDDLSITDVVMASHARTGLPRVILGSIADALIHHLHCPIVVVPAGAAHKMDQATPAASTDTALAGRS